MWPVTLTYFCYGWCLWLYLNWLPLFFKNNFSLDIKNSALFASGVFFAGVVGDTLGGVLSDQILHRTGKLRFARLSVVIFGFFGALLSLLPLLYVHDITIVALCLSSGFFFAELVIGPIWSIPMDIAPKFSGTAAGPHELWLGIRCHRLADRRRNHDRYDRQLVLALYRDDPLDGARHGLGPPHASGKTARVG